MKQDFQTYGNSKNLIDPDNIKRADILLVHTRSSPISYLIRKLNRSYWNHTAIFVSKDNQWPKWVIEALNCGVVARCFELKYLKTIRDDKGAIISKEPSSKFDIAVVRLKNLSDSQTKEIAALAYRWAIQERKYDFLLLIFGMILNALTFRKWYPQWLNKKSEFMCSELIATAFYKVTGFKFSKNTPVNFITPEDIAHCAQANSELEFVN